MRLSGFRASGTMRENRTDKCPVKDTKILQKEERGNFDYRFDKNGDILIVKWNDNKCVTVGTNYDNIFPLKNAPKWNKAAKQKRPISQPLLIKNYNTHMGGVDKHDWLVGKYADIGIRGKKWYWPLFTRMIDMAVTNAWLLYRHLHGSKSLSCLEFRRAVAISYLKRGGIKIRMGYHTPNVVQDVKYDNENHIINTRDQQRRCQREGCKSKPRTYCIKCSVTLCKSCFLPYHVK